MRSAVHNLIIKVDKAINDEIKMGKKTLYINGEYDIYRNKKIAAEVVSVPTKLKGVVLYGKREGHPTYHGKKDKDGKYYPTSYQQSYVTMKDQPINIRKGDTVYFHYLTLSDYNYVGKDEDGMELYLCPYDNVFCYVRNKEISMVNGWVAISPYNDESYEEVEIDVLDPFQRKIGTNTIRVKQSESGIIYDTNDKAVFRHGIVVHRGKAPDNLNYEVAVGDRVIYSDHSEFKNTIEGTEYFLMRLHDIVGVYRGRTIEPIGDYVLMDATERAQSKLILPDKYKRKPNTANVIGVGAFVSEIRKSQHVQYHEASAYYVPVGDVRLCFIPQQDIYLTIER